MSQWNIAMSPEGLETENCDGETQQQTLPLIGEGAQRQQARSFLK
jgi:hypothetical protein